MPSVKGTAVIDLFCGVGGLAHGFYKEGFRVIAGIDADASCKYAFETNNKAIFLNKPIEKVTSNDINKLFAESKTKIMIGCAPCRPFSPYNRKRASSEEWKLLRDFTRLVKGSKPDVISMENVPQLKSHHVFAEFVDNLTRQGYTVSQYTVYCPDYGIPQRRRRLVLFASKFGKVELVAKTNSPRTYKTTRQVMFNLSRIRAGEIDSRDPLHRARNLSPLNLQRIRSTPEGGGWTDWEKSLRLKCHKKKSGKSFSAVYGRMSWDDISPTITTEFINLGSGRFGHPEQDRTISLREAALLQTFPLYYRFFEGERDISFQKLGRHIGNAVPIRLSRVIARSIRRHLDGARNGF